MCIPTTTTATTDTSGSTGGTGDAIGNLGLGLQVAGLFAGAGAAGRTSEATKKGFEFNAAVERNKAIVLEYQARDAESRGQSAQHRQQLKTAALKGTQRARLAAAGQDVNDPGSSAFNIVADTDWMGKVDESTIVDNTAKEAWALRESAKTGMSNAAFLQARADSEDPDSAKYSSLLAGAGAVATNWYRLKTKSGTATI